MPGTDQEQARWWTCDGMFHPWRCRRALGTSIRQAHSYNPGMPINPENDRAQGVRVKPPGPGGARPPLYSVLLLNDDYTPMEFVVEVLVRFFAMNIEKATQ